MELTIRLCCFFYIFSVSLILAYPPPVYYYDDGMGAQEKGKLCNLSMDLLKDSLLKMRQIVVIREEHDQKVAYGMGMIMGRIREKYRYMLETYRDIKVSYHNWYIPRPSSVKYYRPFHFIIALERMHYLELEIDKLVDVIMEEGSEDILRGRVKAGVDEMQERGWEEDRNDHPPERDEPTPDINEPPPEPRKPRGKVERLMEEAQKSLTRQRYLMKKLGHPTNMTTMKKRFLRQWPVEESWPLDRYNYNYK